MEPTRFKEVIITTSRTPRAGERPDKDMYFRSKADMTAGIRERRFVQVLMHPSGDIYATAADAYPTDGETALMPVLAAIVPVFRALPFKRFRLVYVLPPDFGTWMERIKVHGFTPEQRAGRLEEAKVSLALALEEPDTLFLVSETEKEAATDLRNLLDGAHDAVVQAGLRDHAACLLAQIY